MHNPFRRPFSPVAHCYQSFYVFIAVKTNTGFFPWKTGWNSHICSHIWVPLPVLTDTEFLQHNLALFFISPRFPQFTKVSDYEKGPETRSGRPETNLITTKGSRPDFRDSIERRFRRPFQSFLCPLRF